MISVYRRGLLCLAFVLGGGTGVGGQPEYTFCNYTVEVGTPRTYCGKRSAPCPLKVPAVNETVDWGVDDQWKDDHVTECLDGVCWNDVCHVVQGPAFRGAGYGSKCTEDEECSSSLKCSNERCLFSAIRVHGDLCVADEECASEICGDDGYCEGVEAGSRCDNPAACERGHYCEFIGLCKKQSELGEICDPITPDRSCATGLYCERFAENVAPGEGRCKALFTRIPGEVANQNEECRSGVRDRRNRLCVFEVRLSYYGANEQEPCTVPGTVSEFAECMCTNKNRLEFVGNKYGPRYFQALTDYKEYLACISASGCHTNSDALTPGTCMYNACGEQAVDAHCNGLKTGTDYFYDVVMNYEQCYTNYTYSVDRCRAAISDECEFAGFSPEMRSKINCTARGEYELFASAASTPMSWMVACACLGVTLASTGVPRMACARNAEGSRPRRLKRAQWSVKLVRRSGADILARSSAAQGGRACGRRMHVRLYGS